MSDRKQERGVDLAQYIRQLVAKAPLLTEEQKANLARLFRAV